jgi:osmotically-inducible protein OsmY
MAINGSWQLAALGLTLAAATPVVATAAPVPPVSSAGEKPGATAARPMTRDEATSSQIKGRFARSPLLRHEEIIVDTRAGVVTLAGSVPSELARSEAVDLARATPGVSYVDDELRVLISSPDAPAPY